MDNAKYVLNEVHKGIQMGMDSISNINDKLDDTNFKNELLFQYDKYSDILNDINSKLNNYSDFPKELNPMQKAMGWMSVEVHSLSNNSDSNMAELMIQGSNMGIVNGVKLLNQNPNLDPQVQGILTKFVESQQNNIEQLKKYL